MFNGAVSVCKDAKVLKMRSGDDCTTMYVYLMLLNCAPRSDVFFLLMHISSQYFRKSISGALLFFAEAVLSSISALDCPYVSIITSLQRSFLEWRGDTWHCISQNPLLLMGLSESASAGWTRRDPYSSWVVSADA